MLCIGVHVCLLCVDFLLGYEVVIVFFFFFKQKTAYDMRISDWSSDVCSSDLNGYRSLHTTVIGPENKRIEIQIRTQEMHDISELGVAAHWQYKHNGKEAPEAEARQYRWLRELLEILEQASDPEEFLEHTKLNMFQDQVFCFSPKGDLIALPRDATVVDFAYAVHSDIGDTAVGAKVNGRVVPLRTTLRNGDQVEILRSKVPAPNPTWLNFVKRSEEHPSELKPLMRIAFAV